MAENEEELKNILKRAKKESEKASLQLKIQKTNITGSGHITAWQIDWGKMKTVMDFIWTPKSLETVTVVTRVTDLLLGRKVMTNLNNILKSRDITLPIKIYLSSQNCGSPVVKELDHKEV